jgi:hypothetical protein
MWHSFLLFLLLCAAHPVHIHFEEGQIVSKDGKSPPDYERFARKDTYRSVFLSLFGLIL